MVRRPRVSAAVSNHPHEPREEWRLTSHQHGSRRALRALLTMRSFFKLPQGEASGAYQRFVKGREGRAASMAAAGIAS